jgi:hypothetical protein
LAFADFVAFDDVGGLDFIDVTSAIASSVSSVIDGGAIISVRRSVSVISLQSDLSRSGA